MLLMMLEKNMPIDEIIFCDTGKEFPQMYEHIEKVQKYIGGGITVLRAEKTYDYYMFDHIKTRGKNKGEKGYGWANSNYRWCTGNMKINVMRKYFKGKETLIYIGIAYDEPKRHQNIPYNIVHPLYDWKITEKIALEYCYSKGFDFGGLYEHTDRSSCWCCPMQNKKSLENLYKNFPELWRELKDMDKKAYNKFKGKGIEYYENKIISKLRH